MISAIVCTYNRAEKLANCLDALGKASPPTRGGWELLIVDNNSTDNTKAVVEGFARSTALAVRYVFEGEQGLAMARNRGLAEARGDVVAFTDDDCIVDANWLREIETHFSQPGAEVVGGRVELYNPEDRPISIRASRVPARFTEPGDTFRLIMGCNMIFRRSVHERIGAFDRSLGQGAKMPIVPDDYDFIYRAFRAGCDIRYNPAILVHHDHGRRTAEQEQSVKSGYLRSRAAWYAKFLLQGDRRLLKLLYWELKDAVGPVFAKAVRGRSIGDEMWYLRNFTAGFISGVTLYLSRSPATDLPAPASGSNRSA
jgi:glycosyltransferase involved in cell wall biosynthesis